MKIKVGDAVLKTPKDRGSIPVEEYFAKSLLSKDLYTVVDISEKEIFPCMRYDYMIKDKDGVCTWIYDHGFIEIFNVDFVKCFLTNKSEEMKEKINKYKHALTTIA